MYIAFTDDFGRATITNIVSVHGECLKSEVQPQYRMLINDGKETHIAKFPSPENLEAAFLKLRDAIIAKEPYISFCTLESN